jgi:hypothetical protein
MYHFHKGVPRLLLLLLILHFGETLVEINLLGDGLTTHVTGLQSGRALLTCSMATEKHHIASPLHAYGAAVGLLNLSYFRLQVPEAFCAGLP